MGEVLNFAFEKEKQLQNGIKMIVEVLEDVETEGEPTDTSDHEVIHMLLLYFGGTGFYYGTNKAEGNTLGHVMPKGHDSVAAIGPHALGKGGTGHDRMLAHYANDNEEAVASIARSRMSGKNHYRRVFGLELDKRRILTESDAEHIIDIVNKGKRISVRFVMPDGSEHRTVKRVSYDSKNVFISSSELPKTANDNKTNSKRKEKDEFIPESELPRAAHDNETKATRYQKAA